MKNCTAHAAKGSITLLLAKAMQAETYDNTVLPLKDFDEIQEGELSSYVKLSENSLTLRDLG
jgi:hypothetical protein